MDDERCKVGELIREEVGDWDDEVKANARFKAFGGQRCDWEQRYIFWRDLILNLSRRLDIFVVRPGQLKKVWFNREGLSPLCIDQVLLEMYHAGDILRAGELVDPRSGQLPQIFTRLVNLVGLYRPTTPADFGEDPLIISTILKEKAAEVVKVLSEHHWNSSCIVTMRKFHEICGGSEEGSAILSYLSGIGKAKYLLINKNDIKEGVKVCFSPGAVSVTTTLDYDVLHLIWTAEKLQLQLDVINHRYEMSRNSALANQKSGNKKAALKHVKILKLASQNREKCTSLLDRVEAVLNVMADAESTKKISEAIRIGAQAMKENRIGVEDVQIYLEELNECVDSQKQVDKLLESVAGYEGIGDEDIEAEFKKLEFEVGSESSQVPSCKIGSDSSLKEEETYRSADALSNALSNLELRDGVSTESVTVRSVESLSNKQVEDLEILST